MTIVVPSASRSNGAQSTDEGSSNGNPTKGSDIGPIVGGAVGGVAIVAIIVCSVTYFRRRPMSPSRIISDNFVGPRPMLLPSTPHPTEPQFLASPATSSVQWLSDSLAGAEFSTHSQTESAPPSPHLSPMSTLSPERRRPPPPPPMEMTKRREAALHSSHARGTRTSTREAAPPEAHSELMTSEPTASELGGLFAEMQRLRRAIQHIRHGSPPPEYASAAR